MASIDKKFIVKLQGKDFVTYEGLLDLAHQKGLISIKTELVQLPNKENNNQCIMKAIALTDKGQFEGYGDADNGNVNKMIAKHLIRMAETRAKARALRDLTNVGMTALEELGGEEDDKSANTPQKQYKPNVGGKELTENQIKRLYAIAGSKTIDADTVKAQIKTKFNKEVKDLTKAEYDTVCSGYERLK